MRPRGLGLFLPPVTAYRSPVDVGRYPSWTRDEACGSHGAFLRSSEAILVRGPPNRGPGSAVLDAIESRSAAR
jgi:hypothetical protein